MLYTVLDVHFNAQNERYTLSLSKLNVCKTYSNFRSHWFDLPGIEAEPIVSVPDALPIQQLTTLNMHLPRLNKASDEKQKIQTSSRNQIKHCTLPFCHHYNLFEGRCRAKMLNGPHHLATLSE